MNPKRTGANNVKKKDESGKYIMCELCDYRCEKLATFKTHINTKHIEQKCKICGKMFETSMKLISHVAIEHNKEVIILN